MTNWLCGVILTHSLTFSPERSERTPVRKLTTCSCLQLLLNPLFVDGSSRTGCVDLGAVPVQSVAVASACASMVDAGCADMDGSKADVH